MFLHGPNPRSDDDALCYNKYRSYRPWFCLLTVTKLNFRAANTSWRPVLYTSYSKRYLLSYHRVPNVITCVAWVCFSGGYGNGTRWSMFISFQRKFKHRTIGSASKVRMRKYSVQSGKICMLHYWQEGNVICIICTGIIGPQGVHKLHVTIIWPVNVFGLVAKLTMKCTPLLGHFVNVSNAWMANYASTSQ